MRNGLNLAATTTVNQYVWDQSYVDLPIVQFRDGNNDGDCNPSTDANDTIRYYTSDANHNVTTTITVGHTSTDTQHVAYDAYGKAKVYDSTWTTSADPTMDGPLYCGYWFDSETGSYQAENRYYSVVLATWLSRDPIGYGGGVNLYEYVGDSPLSRTDPTGQYDNTAKLLCKDSYISCLHTSLADKDHGSRCGICNDKCIGNGGRWNATMAGFNCAYWNFRSKKTCPN